MPVVFTFDLKKPDDNNDYGRLQTMFEQLGWENLGGTAYRYPRLGTTDEDQPVEDWFNHVIPALMLFRNYVLAYDATIKKFTLDVQTSTGYNPKPTSGEMYGHPPQKTFSFSPVSNKKTKSPSFNPKELKTWLSKDDYPYPKEGKRKRKGK